MVHRLETVCSISDVGGYHDKHLLLANDCILLSQADDVLLIFCGEDFEHARFSSDFESHQRLCQRVCFLFKIFSLHCARLVWFLSQIAQGVQLLQVPIAHQPGEFFDCTRAVCSHSKHGACLLVALQNIVLVGAQISCSILFWLKHDHCIWNIIDQFD